MRQVGMVVVLLALAGSATAGELVLANGSRVQGDLEDQVLVVSTGSDVIEVPASAVAVLSPGEIRLKDGRIVRGTLVGGRLRALTPLGELVVNADELRAFRADGVVPAAAGTPPAPAQESGLLPAPLGQVRAAAQPDPAAAPSAVFASTRGSVPPPAVPALSVAASRLQVITPEIPLRRDALANAPPVGRVRQGDWVTYLDQIDRRLWIMKTLIFDGGHWIKVRSADGTEGWVPADALRATR